MRFILDKKWLITTVLLSCYLLVLLISPIATFADSLRGIEIMRYSWLFDSWNTMYYPNPEAPDELLDEFVSWWTPGQYSLPALFYVLVNDWQWAQKISIILCSLIGLGGWYSLWKKSPYTSSIHAFSFILLICSHHFFWFFILYLGGDLLLFALAPWFFSAALQRKKFYFSIPVWLLLGFWAKAAFLVLAIPVVLYAFFAEKNFIKRAILAFLTACSLLVTYLFYLKMGESPASSTDPEGYSNLPNHPFVGFLYTLGMPFMHNFWIWDITERLWEIKKWFGTVILLFSGGTVLSLFLIWKGNIKNDYTRLFLFVFGFIVLFFGLQQFRGAAISFETRHFFPIALFALPILLNGIKTLFSEKKGSIVFLCILILSLANSSRFFLKKINVNRAYTEQNGLLIPKTYPLPSLSTDTSVVYITDVWDVLPGIEHSHKMAVEKHASAYRLISGIETEKRIYFTQIGKSERKIVGFFYRLSKEDILQLFDRDNLVVSRENGYWLVIEE